MPAIKDQILKGTPTLNVDYIVEAHNAYKHYYNRWQFLGDSYNGGYEYFLGKYLEAYYYESRDDYEKRLRALGLDNHVKSIVGIYNSFLFRKDVKRTYGSIDNDPGLDPFLADADLDGRSFHQFLRELSSLAMVYGHSWVVVDKPNAQMLTRADELQQGIRPYVSIFTPDNVLDWKYERRANGVYELVYLKVKEEIIENMQYVREYTPEEINIYKIDGSQNTGDIFETIPNTLGRVPAVCVYAQRSNIRGVGISPMGDIADIQKELYEFGSEIEQIIRLTNHPSLVKTADTEASAGAGSIVQLPDGLDPGLKPYLLQPDGASIEAVLQSIEKKVESIDRMASLGGIRSIESRRLSGIGLQTEFQMLNAKLADFAMNLEHAEEQIWRLWAGYQGKVWDGEILYPRSFSIQDKANDVALLKMAKESNPTDPMLVDKIEKMMLEALTERSYEEVKEWYDEWNKNNRPSKDMMTHGPVTSADDLVSHLREMVTAGYTDEEIKALHPELTQLFNSESETEIEDEDNG
jgi:hypothetical protein